MIEATETIKEKLKERAFEASRPFCYSDYLTVKENAQGEYFCQKCGKRSAKYTLQKSFGIVQDSLVERKSK
jgi:ribosomal protein L37AE/L43A